MMNVLDAVFAEKKKNVLNIYCTAGFPLMESTTEVMLALQDAGADIIELGIPYSDPVADGPIIQQSNMQALQNGITLTKIFEQLTQIKNRLHIPVVLMGYINPVLQYGMENFCKDAAACGVSGIILPDLPMYEFEKYYASIFKKYKLNCIFLISPSTSKERMKKADALSGGFLYAVSSSTTTGTQNSSENKINYFKKLAAAKFKNPLLIGFGIQDKTAFEEACQYASGAIIGSAFIQHISTAKNVQKAVKEFVHTIRPIEQ